MSLEDIMRDRREKLEKLESAGHNPYPANVERSHAIARALEQFEQFSSNEKEVALAGRIMALRDMGKIIFLDLKDESGQLQVVLKEDECKGFSLLQEALDIGDFLGVRGTLFKTKRGEESVAATKATVAAKSMRPLPSGWHGLQDEELQLRKRYLDILLSEDTKELFYKKEKFWDAQRNFLKDRGFLEVETPVLQLIPGGADARPFKTHHNALDQDVYLRIALELPLKKLLVAGYEKVFEIGRVFRNEGMSREHLQDYTQMEFYWAYHDYHDLMDLVREMFQEVVQKTCGSLKTSWQDKAIDWSGEWPVLDYIEVFEEKNGYNPLEKTEEELRAKAEEVGVELEGGESKARLIDGIYKKTVRPKLIQPAFLINPPTELVPLAKRLEDDANRVARMQPVACGTELGNGFSELNDPRDQKERFTQQEEARDAGDEEAQRMDNDYLEAMEYGMPPAAGFGLSERFFAVLMDLPIREQQIFPLMRPRDNNEA